MKKHTKILMNFFGYGEQDFIPCTRCGTTANDTHHISSRGSGGDKCKDYIENLTPLCRTCHNLAEKNKNINKDIRVRHLQNIINKLNE